MRKISGKNSATGDLINAMKTSQRVKEGDLGATLVVSVKEQNNSYNRQPDSKRQGLRDNPPVPKGTAEDHNVASGPKIFRSVIFLLRENQVVRSSGWERSSPRNPVFEKE